MPIKNRICCIYQIKNKVNNKKYIGSAVSYYHRKGAHLTYLRKRKHCNKYLQRAFIKYGEVNFEFSILERCSTKALVEREQFYLDTLKPEYNILKLARSSLGYKHTEEVKQFLSKIKTGKKVVFTEEHKKNMSIAFRGRVYSEQTRENMSKAKKGKTITWDTGISKAVVEVDCITNEVRIWSSANKASLFYGCTRSAIFNVLNGSRKKCKNKFWMYLIDYEKLLK